MKKKVLSLALSAVMTAALMPTVMVQATGTEFPEYLYVSDFTNGMDKIEVVGNSTYTVAPDGDGNLVLTPTVAQWSNNGTVYLTGSEDWEEYKLELDAQMLGTDQNYLMIAPNHAKVAVGDSDSGYVVKETVDEARKIFKIPDCNRDFDKISKPCLNFHIGICSAPCRGKISHKDYMESINSAKEFIKSGDSEALSLDVLREKMETAAKEMGALSYAKSEINELLGL